MPSILTTTVGPFEVSSSAHNRGSRMSKKLGVLTDLLNEAIGKSGLVSVKPPSLMYRQFSGVIMNRSEQVLVLPEESTETSDGVMIRNEDLGVCVCCGKRLHLDDMESVIERRCPEALEVSNRLGNMVCSEDCMDKARKAKESQGYYWIEVSNGGSEQVFKIGDGVDDDAVQGTQRNLASYASLNRNIYAQSPRHRFAFGVEVEKECDTLEGSDVLGAALQNKWIAVHDGSLDDYYGFELVSPAYSFSDHSTEPFSYASFLDACGALPLNANTSSNCGGHINVSGFGLSGPALASRIEGIFPLLYALYPSRVIGEGNEYSYAVDKRAATTTGRKFRAINTLENRVEFRLFPAVETATQLKRRLAVIHEALKLCESKKAEQLFHGEYVKSLLSVDECNKAIHEAIRDFDSPLWNAVNELTRDNSETDRFKARLGRIRLFQDWYFADSDSLAGCSTRLERRIYDADFDTYELI